MGKEKDVKKEKEAKTKVSVRADPQVNITKC